MWIFAMIVLPFAIFAVAQVMARLRPVPALAEVPFNFSSEPMQWRDEAIQAALAEQRRARYPYCVGGYGDTCCEGGPPCQDTPANREQFVHSRADELMGISH